MNSRAILGLFLAAATAAARLHGGSDARDASVVRARDLVGGGYCGGGSDAACYVSGWPSCCDATSPNGTGGGACSDEPPPCELQPEPETPSSEHLVGTDYCAHDPDADCYDAGWPACCDDAGGRCPATRPPCDRAVTATTAAPTVAESPDALDPAPDPSAPINGPGGTTVGPAYCAAAPDYGCYATENGLPPCCGDNVVCVSDAPPPCDGEDDGEGAVQEETVYNASYCAYDADASCYDNGWPRCCLDLGTECPDDQPLCEILPPASPTTPDPDNTVANTGEEADEAAAVTTTPTTPPTKDTGLASSSEEADEAAVATASQTTLPIKDATLPSTGEHADEAAAVATGLTALPTKDAALVATGEEADEDVVAMTSPATPPTKVTTLASTSGDADEAAAAATSSMAPPTKDATSVATGEEVDGAALEATSPTAPSTKDAATSSPGDDADADGVPDAASPTNPSPENTLESASAEVDEPSAVATSSTAAPGKDAAAAASSSDEAAGDGVPDAASPTTPGPETTPASPDSTGAEANETAAVVDSQPAAPTKKAIEGLGFVADGEVEGRPRSSAVAASGLGGSIASILTVASLFVM